MRAATQSYLDELERRNALQAAQSAAYAIDRKRERLSIVKRQKSRLMRSVAQIDKEIRSLEADMRDLKILELRYKALHLQSETTELNTAK